MASVFPTTCGNHFILDFIYEVISRPKKETTELPDQRETSRAQGDVLGNQTVGRANKVAKHLIKSFICYT